MITTVTLNTSIDKAYYMDDVITNGTVMRVASCLNTAGGKGLNVARIAQMCGADVQAAGFTGGFNGNYLETMLEKDGIRHVFTRVKGETRSCINILDKGYGSTEYLEPGCEISQEEENSFLEQFPELIKESQVVTISGSIPKGVSKDIYRRLITIIKDAGKQVILDTSGELLAEGICAGPTMVKPNQDEIELLFGAKIHRREEVIACARKIYEKGIPFVVISLGSEGALLVCEDGVFQGLPPKIEPVNTVGCGDSMVGAFAAAMERKFSPQEALRYAVAVATANAMSVHTGDFDPVKCEQLLQQVKLEKR